jgi:protein-tyrosine phosphatase
MTEVFQWRTHPDPAAVVARAAQGLRAGGLVALPTETVYTLAASALVPDAVERLRGAAAAAEGADVPLTLSLRAPAECEDWVPELPKYGRRFARRCWPGPVTLVFASGTRGGLSEQLPAAVRSRVCPDGRLCLGVAAHAAVRQTLEQVAGPVVVRAARAADGPARTAPEVLTAYDGQIDLLVDDGPCHFGQPATVVQVAGDGWDVLEEGVVPRQTLGRLAQCVILFVCTGNTCRSPLAEGLCRDLLARRLGCPPGELAERGFIVLSAGVSAMMGCGATPEAVATAQTRGVDLSGHASQPLTASLLGQADYVFAMTAGHLRTVAARFPHAADRLQLLSPRGEDVVDPIGGDQHVYDRCAEQIVACLEDRLPELQP